MHGAGSKKKPGGRPMLSGRYARLNHEKLKTLFEEHQESQDPLDTLSELAMCRAIFQDFVQRYGTFSEALLAWHEDWKQTDGKPSTAKPTQILDIADACKLISEITRMVERIEKAKAVNAISRKDFSRIISEMARTVQLVVTDEQQLKEIHRAWNSIALS
jgi:hemoglobin-like flavoprotein